MTADTDTWDRAVRAGDCPVCALRLTHTGSFCPDGRHLVQHGEAYVRVPCPTAGCRWVGYSVPAADDPTEPDDQEAERLLRRHFRSKHPGEAL